MNPSNVKTWWRTRGPRISLRSKLSGGFVAVTLCGGLVAGVLVDHAVQGTTRSGFEDRLASEATMLGQMTATALFGEVDPGDASLVGPVRSLSEAVHTRLAVLSKDGVVVADSAVDDPGRLPSEAAAPEIASARSTGAGAAVRDGRLYAARAIVRDGATLGYAEASVPLSDVERYVIGVRARIAWASALALVAALGLGLGISARIVRPVRALAEGARRVGGGDFEHAIAVSTRDEMGDLADSFNQMTRNLRRTMEVLDGRNKDMRIVLDNVTQGLLTLDGEGKVSNERSAAVDRWFGAPEPGDRFWDVLARFDPTAAVKFDLQWGQLVEGVLPLELNVDQLPTYAARGDQRLELTYTPLLDERGELSKLLLVITDVTARLVAERAEAEQREVAAMFEHMMQDNGGVLEYFEDTTVQVRVLTDANRPPLPEVRRRLHTLKGNAAIYGMQRLSTLCDRIESTMAETGEDLSTDDRSLLRSAWAVMHDRLAAFARDARNIVIGDSEYTRVLRALEDGTPRPYITRMVRDWRMDRASDRLGRFAASARHLAMRLDKGAIAVEVPPCELRLPRENWVDFWAAFTHVVRNAVDHGLEAEVERRRAGASTPPTLRLAAFQREREVVVEVADNGRGIDWERLAERARRAGLPATTHEDLVAALFADGVSTRDEVTEISGRGVGLAATREACERMGGRVQVESQRGRGSTFRFHVPLPPPLPTRCSSPCMARTTTPPVVCPVQQS